jgi:hypothetical protein
MVRWSCLLLPDRQTAEWLMGTRTLLAVRLLRFPDDGRGGCTESFTLYRPEAGDRLAFSSSSGKTGKFDRSTRIFSGKWRAGAELIQGVPDEFQ